MASKNPKWKILCDVTTKLIPCDVTTTNFPFWTPKTLGQGDVQQVSVNGQCDIILLAVQPSGHCLENKLWPSLRGRELVERE
jgi:hypothetical protein